MDYNYEKLASAVDKKNIGKGRHLVERYKWFLPIEESEKAVSLNEGNTPLIKCKRLGDFLGLKRLYVKDETRNPTGTFKDRAITVGITMLLSGATKRWLPHQPECCGRAISLCRKGWSGLLGLNARRTKHF